MLISCLALTPWLVKQGSHSCCSASRLCAAATWIRIASMLSENAYMLLLLLGSQ